MANAGKRPSLVLLPGLMCDAAVWAPQVAALPGEVNCIVPAYGLLDSLTAMAHKVLDEVQAERFNVAGHSMGGRVAMEVQRLAPHRVERLALLDTGYKALQGGEDGERERAGRMALLEIARMQGMRAMAARWATGMVHPGQLDTSLFESVLDMIERSSAEQFEAQIKALLARPDASDALRAVRCPALVLCGREDLWAPVAQHEALHAALPGSSLVVVEQCGHMCTMEQPGAINAALRQWLARPT